VLGAEALSASLLGFAADGRVVSILELARATAAVLGLEYSADVSGAIDTHFLGIKNRRCDTLRA
jgi:hypothetical protein